MVRPDYWGGENFWGRLYTADNIAEYTTDNAEFAAEFTAEYTAGYTIEYTAEYATEYADDNVSI